MISLTASFSNVSKHLSGFVFGSGMLLLLVTWLVVYGWETLFAESHLASYYCCLMPQELQKLSALERTVSDFFRAAPGRDLPGLLFILLNAVIFVNALRKTTQTGGVTWLPLSFALLGILYLLADFSLLMMTMSVSDQILGPQTSPYKGYGRTWYGIVSHIALWIFFLSLLRNIHASRPLRYARRRSARRD